MSVSKVNMSRSKVTKSSLLIVEDNPDDLTFIHKVYKKNLPSWDIKVVNSGREALKIIEDNKRKKFDIISLDINLSSTANSDIWTADGRTILRKAIELNACKAIIVISGIQTDDTIDWIFPDRREKLRIQTNIGSILNGNFANRNILFQKVDGWKEVFEEVVSQKKILALLERSYQINISNYEHTDLSKVPTIKIKQKGESNGNSKTVENADLTNILLTMCLRRDRLITKEEVYFIHRQKVLREIKKEVESLLIDYTSINQRHLLEVKSLIKGCEIGIQKFLRQIIPEENYKTRIKELLREIEVQIEKLPKSNNAKDNTILQEIKKKIKTLNFDDKHYIRLVDTKISTVKNYMIDSMGIVANDVFRVKHTIGWELDPNTNFIKEE